MMMMMKLMLMLVGMGICRGRTTTLEEGCGRVAEGAVGCWSEPRVVKCDASHPANDLLVVSY